MLRPHLLEVYSILILYEVAYEGSEKPYSDAEYLIPGLDPACVLAVFETFFVTWKQALSILYQGSW